MANKRKRRILFLFIVPALVFYLVFWISPVLMSFFYGLTNWSGLGDYDFVGLDANYAQTECQFRYCGTAIPFLTVRSTAR